MLAFLSLFLKFYSADTPHRPKCVAFWRLALSSYLFGSFIMNSIITKSAAPSSVAKRLRSYILRDNVSAMLGTSCYILADILFYFRCGRVRRNHRLKPGTSSLQPDFCDRIRDRHRKCDPICHCKSLRQQNVRCIFFKRHLFCSRSKYHFYPRRCVLSGNDHSNHGCR